MGPILQLADFNQGRYLKRSTVTNETCPFQLCGENLHNSEYRMHTPDVCDALDVHSLGGIFFYLMSGASHPSKPKNKTQLLSLPSDEDLAKIKERLRHPAYLALKEVMVQCWTFNAT